MSGPRSGWEGTTEVDVSEALVRTLDELAEVRAEIGRSRRLAEASAANHRALSAALRMVRDAIEEVGPVGALPSVEHEGVEPHQVAEGLVQAITRLAASRVLTLEDAPDPEVARLTAERDLLMSRISAAIEHADTEGNDVQVMRDILWPPGDDESAALEGEDDE